MKLNYDAKTDSLYFELAQRPGADAREITEGVVIDLDAGGILIGIDIQHASRNVDLRRIEAVGVPLERKAAG